jgi:Tol biopolymer transport system component
MTGPAFSPDGSRLYFSSQRNPGRTYEISGPFLPNPHG